MIYDLLDTTNQILFEAKSDATSRPQLRMAIGQLADYSYHGFGANRKPIRTALLLPAAPTPDIRELLGYLEIGIAYETERGSFIENYPWE